MLEVALRQVGSSIALHHVNGWSEFTQHLSEQTALIFCPETLNGQQENRLLELVQQRSPDSLIIQVSTQRWQPLKTRLIGVEACVITAQNAKILYQQISYLLNYATLKTQFRQCKHLLSIAELRCQWLVDYSREPVAYVANGRHLHANIAYLSLFGFTDEAAALRTPVIDLVKADEQKIFAPANSNAELSARPSSKLLLTFQRPDKEVFRAELRFIPSVFRGRRCVQLHLQPVDHLDHRAKKPARQVVDPWSTPAKSTVEHAAAMQAPVAVATTAPTPKTTATQSKQAKQPSKARSKQSAAAPAQRQALKPKNQMLLRFQETLNLRTHTHPALQIVEPSLRTVAGKQVPYMILVRQMEKRGARYRLDYWALSNTLRHIKEQDQTSKHKQAAQYLISLGSWLFAEPKKLRELLALLAQNQSITEQVILQVNLADYTQYESVAGPVLSALSRTGVKLGVNIATQAGLHIVPLAQATGLSLVRMHVASAKKESTNGEFITARISEMMHALEQIDIAIMVDDVRNITMLNQLCTTPATYLQGGILNRFPAK